MDNITRELDNLILRYDFDGKTTDVACYNKIKMDYFLMLTVAATWDIKHSSMDKAGIKAVMKCLQRPQTGKLIRLIDSRLNLSKSIVNIFDLYKEGRNLLFGHTTFDEFEAMRLNGECEQCWHALMELESLADKDSDLIRKLYQEENDFYYVARVKQNGEMLVKQCGNKNGFVKFPKLAIKARLSNINNDIQEGDLFIAVDDKYIKISPFIQFNDKEELFMMLMDVETAPLAFKMAYVYRTQYASDSVKYLDEFPAELKGFFPEETKKLGKNGIALNKFSQYELFEQEYYKGIHKCVQTKLDQFITGNMAYGAVRGVGGVGKTSAVFMWMNRILNNEDGILDTIRQHFNLRRIIFLSAKTKIYSRDLNEENLSNFYEMESDVHNYHDVVDILYAIFHPSEKIRTSFEDKVKWIKDYSNQAHGILIIIDDYESLPAKSREDIQFLKDFLKPNVIKMLITTRFASKESKDIIVERLDEKDCSRMTDHIFDSSKWKTDITISEMHSLTSGLPLLIWYAKAYFKMGQLSSKRLKSNFSGPAEGLEGYLYDNFVQCFEDIFTKNFLMVATRYYELNNVLQISKKTAVFLCLKEPKEYKLEDEEFYFQELADLKLISINQSTRTVDFSPLMIYMDKSTKKQEPKEQYQDDALKVLTQLNEEKYQGLYAVIESAEFLEDTIKCRILRRIVDFSQNNEKVKIEAINKLFALSNEKIRIYEANTQIFQNEQILIKSMSTYLLDNVSVISGNYKLIRDFVKSVSVSIDNQEDTEQVAYMGIELVQLLLSISLDERDSEYITNPELATRTQFLTGLAVEFVGHIQDTEKREMVIEKVNETLDDIAIFCEVEEI
ncbi:hypothetical protein D3Z53_20005 [Lachnospiraceae bacterium]|nr:hypothetical protein [uncultured Schaedlerella sp.]EOS40104.1 hypothetical protein C808_01075 [Lachnospiraceae bacterium M18-1]NBI60270.1 hypothetical protein [Lachnospiraceae bacterium]